MTIIDEDILNVEHVIGTMTSLGIIITVCHACVPNEVRIYKRIQGGAGVKG